MRTLYQFPISNYCEKTRWHLDAKHLSYRTRDVFPGAHRLLGRRYGVRGTVPFLVDGPRAFGDSTDIALHLEEAYDGLRLVPREEERRDEVLAFESSFDENGGPATRVVAYGALMETPGAAARALFAAYSRPIRAVGRVIGRFAEASIRRMYRISPASVARANASIDEAFQKIEKAIDGDPRRYLVGDSFTLADLTAAALLSPIVAPAGSPYAKLPSAALDGPRARLRDRPAWAWIERVYRDHRR